MSTNLQLLVTCIIVDAIKLKNIVHRDSGNKQGMLPGPSTIVRALSMKKCLKRHWKRRLHASLVGSLWLRIQGTSHASCVKLVLEYSRIFVRSIRQFLVYSIAVLRLLPVDRVVYTRPLRNVQIASIRCSQLILSTVVGRRAAVVVQRGPLTSCWTRPDVRRIVNLWLRRRLWFLLRNKCSVKGRPCFSCFKLEIVYGGRYVIDMVLIRVMFLIEKFCEKCIWFVY